MNPPNELSKLRWLCRRGMKELDVLLEWYLAHVYPTAATAEQAAFHQLLDWEDPDIYALMLGQTTSSNLEVQHVVERIRQRA